jgi:hypothetical protein
LPDFSSGDAQKQQVRSHPVLGAALRRFQHDLVVLRAGLKTPAEHLLPELREPERIGRVDAQALDADVHAATLLPLPPVVHLFCSGLAMAASGRVMC